ncbi:hypothetical protein F5Y17DRAFT_436430 [Xylariaceae sp. FL0594]|nr:hypothetical protein F5Y17DRAFT_436430 [Xylariaceae sp. FL0594]
MHVIQTVRLTSFLFTISCLLLCRSFPIRLVVTDSTQTHTTYHPPLLLTLLCIFSYFQKGECGMVRTMIS